MRFLRVLLVIMVGLSVTACAKSKFRTYNGPEVTSIQVHKADRKMYLLHNGEVLESYDIGLGFAPEGHKQFEGDGKTPEGTYFISHRNPKSRYHLSLGVSYPNDADRAYAKALADQYGKGTFQLVTTVKGKPCESKGRKVNGLTGLTTPRRQDRQSAHSVRPIGLKSSGVSAVLRAAKTWN